MRYSTNFETENETPKPLLYLMILIGVISIGSSLLSPLFSYFFNFSGPEKWLSLSLYGIENFRLYQIVSYPFVQSSQFYGISISYLISLSFSLYVLWTLGTSIIDRIGIKSFFKLYFSSIIISAIFALICLKLTSDYRTQISGQSAVLLSLLTFWTLLYSEAELGLFFIIQFKAKWILAIVASLILLNCLSHLDITSFILYSSSILVAYIYGLSAYELSSPYEFMSQIDKKIIQFFNRSKDDSSSKIVDIKTGRPVNDEEFINEMLEKISKKGEDSLSIYERMKLDEITKRKK